MKRYGIFGVALLLVGGVGAQEKTTGRGVPLSQEQSTPDVPEKNLQTRRFVAQKLAIKVPLGWQTLPVATRQAGTLISLSPPDTTSATLALSYADDPERQRLPDTLPATIASALAKRYPNYQQTGKLRLSLAGSDAWQVDGQVRPAGQNMVVVSRQVYLLHAGRIYIFTLTTKKEDFTRLAPSLDRMLKSISWLE